MKTVACDLCSETAQGETFDDWMNALRPHYMQAHPEIMTDPTKTQADMMQWMDANKVRFENA